MTEILKSYSDKYDGLIAYRMMDSCYSSPLSFEKHLPARAQDDDSPYCLTGNFVRTFSLSRSMVSISTGLTVGVKAKKRVVKAKFDRKAYAKTISGQSENCSWVAPASFVPHPVNASDYSLHIKETSGKVLKCSEVWFK